MADSLQEVLNQVNAAAAPALDGVYQESDFERVQREKYEQELAGLGNYKGKDSNVVPLSWDEYQASLPQEAPPPTLQQTIQPQPQPQVQPRPTPTTPCQSGQCWTNSSLGGMGNPLIQRNFEKGLIAGGDFGRYGQLRGNARMRSMGATPEALEKTNKEYEQYQLADMRRTPEWFDNYQKLTQQYPNNPDLAMRQSDLLTGNQFGGAYAATSQQYLAPEAQKAVNADIDQRNALGVLLGQQYLDQNPYENIGQGTVSPQGVLTGYAPNEDGTNSVTLDVNGDGYSIDLSADTTLPTIGAVGNGTTINQLQKDALAVDQNRINLLKANAAIDQKDIQNDLRRQDIENRANQAQQKIALEQQKIANARTGGTNTSTGKANNALTAIPEQFTAKGRVDYLSNIQKQRDTEAKLRKGMGTDKPDGNGVSVEDKIKLDVGFAPDMRITDQLFSALLNPAYAKGDPNYLVAYSKLKQYNEALDRIQDESNWATEKDVANTLQYLYTVKNAVDPYRDKWLKSDKPELQTTGREVEAGLNYLSAGIKEAQDRLKRYETIRKAEQDVLNINNTINGVNSNGTVGGL